MVDPIAHDLADRVLRNHPDTESLSRSIFVHTDAENVFEFSEVTFPSVPLNA
jgi:hypothetical protein